MRYIRFFCIILLLLFLLIVGTVEVPAMNTGFSTESLSRDEIETFLKNVNISMLAEEPPKKPIECFDVNENEVIAIGCSNSENKTVGIYTSDGSFQYGYSFECSGSFGIELHEDTLMIYFVRSDVAISVDSTGEVKSILKIQNTSENNSYWNDTVFFTKREVGGNTYTIKNNMGIFNVFASSYSQLIATNVNGEEIVIYDVSSTQFLNALAVFIGVLVFICLVLIFVILQFINLKRDTRRSQ